jgi:O-antigen/teichoic acid export membrane protein
VATPAQKIAAIRWNGLATSVRIASQFALLVLMARILAPSEFATIAVVLSVVAFAQLIADFGVANLLLHHHNLADEISDSLFWLNLGWAVLVASALAGFGTVCEELYDLPELAYALQIASCTLPINSATQHFRAPLERRLIFRPLAASDILGSLAGLLVTLYLARTGVGLTSVVFGSVAAAVIGAFALALGALKDTRRIRYRCDLRASRDYIAYGAQSLMYSLVGAANIQSDVLVGAKSIGATDFGSYTLPRDLCLRLSMIVNMVVTRVALPVMASLQSNLSAVVRTFHRVTSITAFLNAPIFFFLAFFADELIAVVFGLPWADSGAQLQLLALWGLVRSLGNPVGSLAMALGKPQLALAWGLLQLAFTVPVYVVASKYAPSSYALVVVGVASFSLLLQWRMLVLPLVGITFFEYLRPSLAPVLISAVGAASGHFIASAFSSNPTEILLMGAIMMASTSLVLSYRFNNESLMAIVKLVRK